MLFIPAFGTTLWVLATVTSLLLGRRILLSLRRRNEDHEWALQNHCKPAKRLPSWDPLLGLGWFFRMNKDIQNHTTLETVVNHFESLQAHTFELPFLGRTIIVTREPENIKTVLALKFDDYGIGIARSPLRSVLGEGIFTTDGPAWRHSRDLLKPVFARSQISDLRTFEKHLQRLIALLPDDGSTVDLQPLFFDLTFDTVTDFLFGQSTGILLDKSGKGKTQTNASSFAETFDRSMTYLATSLWVLLEPYLPFSQYNKDRRGIHMFVDQLVDRAIAAQKSSEKPTEETSPAQGTFIKELLMSTQDRVQIRTEALNVLLAGRETTASFLSDIWFELARNPLVFQRLRDEIRKLWSSSDKSLESLKSLPYLRAILNETLRLHPTVPQNSRLSLAKTSLPLGGGPKGESPVAVGARQLVIYAVYAMHRRRDIYGQDADEFRPERWLDNQDNGSPPLRPGWAFLPFNGGPRVCIGQQYALAQVSYVTVRLTEQISGLESRCQKPWQENLTLTARNLNGCMVGLTSMA